MSGTSGVGIDLVDVARFASLLARRPRLAARLFTPEEIRDAGHASERLAARFAAKEATWKALGAGLGSVNFHDVVVVRGPAGDPTLHLSGRAAERAAQVGTTHWHVSLTHTHLTAGAVVVGSIS